MKDFISILITLLVSIILIALSELFKISTIIVGIIAVSSFIILLIFLFSYYLKQINNKIGKNTYKINEFSKDLNINNRLIKLEKDIEWIGKGVK